MQASLKPKAIWFYVHSVKTGSAVSKSPIRLLITLVWLYAAVCLDPSFLLEEKQKNNNNNKNLRVCPSWIATKMKHSKGRLHYIEIILNILLTRADLHEVPAIFEDEFWFMLIWKIFLWDCLQSMLFLTAVIKQVI